VADQRLRATAAQLSGAFRACTTLNPVYRGLLKLIVEELRLIEDHLGQLDHQMAQLLAVHHDAAQRLAAVPGLGADSAQQVIAEVGATAATFPSPNTSRRGWAPAWAIKESAGKNYSHRCPKGNRQMRRVLNQAAKRGGEGQGHGLRHRLPPTRAAPWARASDWRDCHRLCRLIWKILHPRTRRQRRDQEGASAQDDPRTANP
jgi:transposase